MHQTIPPHIRKRLPKAPLISLEWAPTVLPGQPFLQRNRLANAVRLRIGSVVVTHRAPWLSYAAQANHPHLFR